MSSGSLVIALVVALATDVAPAAAQSADAEVSPTPMTEDARAHYERGLSLYGEKDYAAAIAAFEAGHAIEPRREFLFAQAQARRLAGQCAIAVTLYQRFLATSPPAAQVNATQIGLARCAQQLADAQPPAPPVAATPPPAGGAAPPSPSSPRREPPRWSRDQLGGALAGAGLVAVGVGAGFLAASFAARDDGDSYAEYDRRWGTAQDRWNVAAVSLTAGGLLLTGAVLRYASVRRRAGSGLEAAVLSPPAPGVGVGLTLRGRF